MKTPRFVSALRTGALLLGAIIGLGTAEAASIRFAVKVPGYSTAGWIQVRPELRSLLGGRVAYLPQYGGWVTDRAARGEEIRTTIAPDRWPEYEGVHATIGLRINGREVFPPITRALTFVGYQRVSINPADDNIVAWANTPAGSFSARVPVGSR